MSETSPEAIIFAETCPHLRIPRSSLYKLIQAGKIPYQKLGRYWRFHRPTIIGWIAGRDSSESMAEAEKGAPF